MRVNIFILALISMLFLTACSSTATGPVTGRKYKVEVGGWKDMEAYKKARKEALEDKQQGDKTIDCEIDDPPEKAGECK
ncbi:MAG: hypothetical protein OQL06_00315 [Gammaproteobacteria bacterium]|nr:hypothetical protein [Gammaproteobacteria bacterium]